jgi:formamidopyrimidine-DNA glycosylase
VDRRVLEVSAHPQVRDFRGTDVTRLTEALTGRTLLGSEARGKQMLFRFSRGGWLGIHLGMSGSLRVTSPRQPVEKHDHLVLRQAAGALVFSDPRQFGRVRFAEGRAAPEWWTSLPPAILSEEFTIEEMTAFLRRHARAPIKAVLLRQERFPGIGNWMADEILWRAAVHPATRAGALAGSDRQRIRREMRVVVRTAMRTIGEEWNDLPRGWLFHERWGDGGLCPRTGTPLVRESIGGRTTCWSPGRQGERRPGRRSDRKRGGHGPNQASIGGVRSSL